MHGDDGENGDGELHMHINVFMCTRLHTLGERLVNRRQVRITKVTDFFFLGSRRRLHQPSAQSGG